MYFQIKMDPITNLITILVIAALLCYFYAKWKLTYWQRRGVCYIEPEMPYGNIKQQVKKELYSGEMLMNVYNHFKSEGQKYGGIYAFLQPIFIPVDIELIQNILLNDFSSFVNHGTYVNEKMDPLSGNLFNLENDKWRNMRTKLTPTFTSGI